MDNATHDVQYNLLVPPPLWGSTVGLHGYVVGTAVIQPTGGHVVDSEVKASVSIIMAPDKNSVYVDLCESPMSFWAWRD